MNKKILALALAAGAAWLFKTKKGNEVRQEIGKRAGEIAGKLKDQYGNRKGQVAESMEG